MRMKYFFLSMLGLASLASCGNDEQASANDDAEKFVTISLNYVGARDGVQNRAIGDNQTAGNPTLTNVYVEFYDAVACGGNKLSTFKMEIADVAKLGTSAVTLTAPATALSMRMVANNGATTILPTAITDYQGKLVKEGIPYEGKGDITGNVDDGYAASVNMNVAVARVEILGQIACTNDANGCTVAVDGVYCNNYLETVGGAAHVLSATIIGGVPSISNGVATMFDLSTADATAWGTAFNTASPTKCAGYQLFAGSYGVTMVVTVTKADNSTSKGFIVVKSFKKADGDNATIAALEAGKIYKLDLATSKLEDLFVKDSPETPVTPDPSGQDKAVVVTANVQTWTLQSVLPEL